MNNEVLVKVENVSKKFCRSLSRCIGNLKRSLWYGVKDISSELFGTARNGQLRKDEFWTVEDMSLTCQQCFSKFEGLSIKFCDIVICR